jgi:hypothetical protein
VSPERVIVTGTRAAPSPGLEFAASRAKAEPPAAWRTPKNESSVRSICPVREGPRFCATVKLTVPFPVPLAPDVIVIHGARLAAVHAQPCGATIWKLPCPPAAGNSGGPSGLTV